MTREQWWKFGGCPTCEAKPAAPCTTRLFGMGDDLEAPHAARPLYASQADIARLMNDVVDVSVREGVAVRPGDTLVVRLDPESFSPCQVGELVGELEAIRAHVEARLPRGARVVVIAAAGELAVVRADDGGVPS